MKTKYSALFLSIIFILGICVYAEEIMQVPVVADIEPTEICVSVPVSLPVSVDKDGNVKTADNCVIINESSASVRVKSVNISAKNGWTLTDYRDIQGFDSAKVDSNKLAFMLTIGGSQPVYTDNSENLTQSIMKTPAVINSHEIAPVKYDVMVTPVSAAVKGLEIADIVFILEWDT